MAERRRGELVNEADVVVSAGGNTRDDLAPGYLGIDDGLAPAPAVIYHHNEILHGVALFASVEVLSRRNQYFRKSEISQADNSENQKKRLPRETRARGPARIRRATLTSSRSSFLRCAPAMGLGRLACPGRGLGAQTLDLAPWQGNADLPDPFQFHPVDRLGVEAREVDLGGGFPPLDGFQVSLAGLHPDPGFFAVEAGDRMALLPVDHNNVAILVFRQHGIA